MLVRAQIPSLQKIEKTRCLAAVLDIQIDALFYLDFGSVGEESVQNRFIHNLKSLFLLRRRGGCPPERTLFFISYHSLVKKTTKNIKHFNICYIFVAAFMVL